MQQTAPAAIGALVGQSGLVDRDTMVVMLGGIALALLIAILFAVLLLGRRQQGRDIREIVMAVEDLRAGEPRRRIEIDERSSLALVSDAVNRLGQDLSVRLREAEGAGLQLRALSDTARDLALVATDPDWDIRSFSPGACTMFGWDEESVWGRPVSVLFPEESWRDLLPKLSRKALRERGIETQATLQRYDGELFEGSVAVRALGGSKVEEAGFLLVIRDVSAQARLESELRASEESYRGLVEGLSDGVFLLEAGRLVYANAALAEMCGLPADQMVGTLWRDYVEARDVLQAHSTLGTLEGHPAARANLSMLLRHAAGGPPARVRVRASAVRYGGRAAVLGIVEDVTAESRIAEELQRNESRLDAVLEAFSDGILVLTDGPDGGLVHLTNRRFLELFRLAERDVLGTTETRLLEVLRTCGGGAETVAELLASPERGVQREVVELSRAGRREVEVMVADLRDRAGSVLGRVLACRDLTSYRESWEKLEAHVEELRSSKRELEDSYNRLQALYEDRGRRGHELERLNRELRTLDRMKSNLLGNVSHELQTPLVSIRGYTEMILRGRLGAITDEQRKGLELSLKNIDRLISMIDTLLAFSRKQDQAMRLETFPLEPLVRETVELLRQRLEGKHIQLDASLEPAGVEVDGDRDKIQQVFLNVLSNAIKFTEPGGKVALRVAAGAPGFAVVRVSDTGVGIPKADLERIFERHFRAAQEGGAGAEGSGLGLSIVRDILRLHGCTIRADSEPGQGSVFTFTLPLADRERTGAPRGAGESPASRGAPPIRIVDDAGPPAGSPPGAPAPPDATDRPEDDPDRPPPRPRRRLRIIRKP